VGVAKAHKIKEAELTSRRRLGFISPCVARYWGENGYFRIVRGTNECNIEGGVTGSHANAVWSKAG